MGRESMQVKMVVGLASSGIRIPPNNGQDKRSSAGTRGDGGEGGGGMVVMSMIRKTR
jgi:hypothetical protein